MFGCAVRKPFTVDAVKVTTKNIEEIAELIGDVVERDDGTVYIQVDTSVVPYVTRVYPGFFLTRVIINSKPRYRAYSRRVFAEQFVGSTPELMDWVDYLEGLNDPNPDLEYNSTARPAGMESLPSAPADESTEETLSEA